MGLLLFYHIFFHNTSRRNRIVEKRVQTLLPRSFGGNAAEANFRHHLDLYGEDGELTDRFFEAEPIHEGSEEYRDVSSLSSMIAINSDYAEEA